MSRAKIQITIVDRLGNKGCHRGHHIGESFDFDTQRGQICPMAAHVLFPYIDILRYGGQIPGQKENTALACCSDVETILVFYIEKLEEPELFSTQRMTCRALQAGDIKTVYAMTQNPSVSCHLRHGVHTSIQHAAKLVMDLIQPQHCSFLVFDQETKEPMGVISAKWIETKSYDITIFLALSYQNNHRGPELLNWLKQYLQDNGLAHTLQAYVAKDNTASATMLQRMNFQLVESLDQGQVNRWVCHF